MTSYPMDTDGCNTYNNSKEIQLQNRLGHTKHSEIKSQKGFNDKLCHKNRRL